MGPTTLFSLIKAPTSHARIDSDAAAWMLEPGHPQTLRAGRPKDMGGLGFRGLVV